MNLPDVVQIVAYTIAFAANATKLLGATRFLWDRLPAGWQRVLPGVVIALGELPQLLTGTSSPTELGVALMSAIALAMPGKHTDSVR